jgi:hypothetical protein
MSKTKTMKEMYTEIMERYPLTEEHKAFLMGRVEQIDKKSASRTSKPNEENERLKGEILAVMEPNTTYRAMDIEKAIGLSSPQKATALLGQLVNADLVTKSSVKGVTYYTKADQ